MSLNARISILLAAVVLVYALVDHAAQRVLVYPSFETLELDAARTDLQRVSHAFEAELQHLDAECANWSSMSAMQHLFDAADAEPCSETMLPQIFETHRLSLLYACGSDGTVHFGKARDVVSGAAIRLHDFPSEKLSTAHPLLTNTNYLPSAGDASGSAISGPVAGVFLTERGPMLVSSRPIADPRDSTRSVGKLILGRLVDEHLLAQLREQTGVRFDLHRIDGEALPADVQLHVDDITSTAEPVLDPASAQELVGYFAIPEIRSPAALIVRATLPRSITERGSQAARYGLISTIAAGLILLLVLLNLLRRAVVRPIGELTRLAVEIGRRDDVAQRIDSKRSDEVGALAREFDSMLTKLAQSRARSVDSARAAGMSEIASGVLHNIGNVLNSVNVSAALVAEKSQSRAVTDLSGVVTVLRPHAQDMGAFLERDPRGRHLFPLLDGIANQLLLDKTSEEKEVHNLLDGIEHIKTLVQAHQGLTGCSGVREHVQLDALVDTAVEITDQPANAVEGLRIERAYEALGPILVDRHRVLQILVNVVQNARQSIRESCTRSGLLVLRVTRTGENRVRVEVEDNGVGIPEENLQRIFTHGFTTKAGGHGFGLHSSANAATELFGRLWASSAGAGRGACFTIEFPVQEVVRLEVTT